ncbi:MAG: hypothetical protein JXL80_13235 [Planctomycetes bacterium]|nr:hypothetical protein [Planctomycetota bacterium]
MRSTHRVVVVLGLGLLVGLVTVGSVWAEDEATDDTKKQSESTKSDKYLGIDWGSDESTDTKKKDDPDAAAPSKAVDLTTSLNEQQQKRLDVIKKSAAKGDEMAEVAAKTLSGEKKGTKKETAIRQYENASGIFLKASGDIEKLAKPMQDQDVRLTLLRNYGDAYKKQACEMLCKAGMAAIETADGKIDNIKEAVKLFKRARGIDPDYPGIADGVSAARTAYEDIVQKAAVTKQRKQQGSGGDDDDDDDDDNGDDDDG